MWIHHQKSSSDARRGAISIEPTACVEARSVALLVRSTSPWKTKGSRATSAPSLWPGVACAKSSKGTLVWPRHCFHRPGRYVAILTVGSRPSARTCGRMGTGSKRASRANPRREKRRRQSPSSSPQMPSIRSIAPSQGSRLSLSLRLARFVSGLG